MSVDKLVVDPLTALPPEIILRVLEFCPIAALASLTSVSKGWHNFIDTTHQEVIYGSESRTSQPPGASRDRSFLSDTHCISKLFEGTSSWKDLCKRQTLLARNWAKESPDTQESVLQVGNEAVWRFRPDFKRRFFLSTSHAGGLNVTDMDTGQVIWRRPSTLDTDEDSVRPYAHLEYQDGVAVFDRDGDAIEVWQTDLEGTGRGEFKRVAVLNHDCHTRGFQLSYGTLCVVSNEGQGFVYDMTQRPPKQTTHLKIERDAVGHLDQSEDVVIYSIGPKGYYVYDKKSGSFLGTLEPSHCTDIYHINPPSVRSPYAGAALAGVARHTPIHRFFSRAAPRRDSLVPLKVRKGPLAAPADIDNVRLRADEWGAGMVDGDLFVGFSRAGRVFVCSNWRKALRDTASLDDCSSLIECESDGSNFDLGGWLSVHDHRLMFEIQNRIYVVALDDQNRVQEANNSARKSYSLLTSSAPQFAVPVSFMTLCDDAIMATYTTLGWRQPTPGLGGGDPQQHIENPARIFPTKAIRIISLAPDLSGNKSSSTSQDDTAEHHGAGGLWNPSQNNAMTDDIWRAQPGLLELVGMLGGEFEDFGGAEVLSEDDILTDMGD